MPKDFVLIDDQATWDNWKKLCDEVDKELEEEIAKMFEGLEEAEGVKSEVTDSMVPNVDEPWKVLGMTEEEWLAQQDADADTWED